MATIPDGPDDASGRERRAGGATRRLRILCFAPHFAEYASRLANALSVDADVLLVCESRNLELECSGLDLTPASPSLSRTTYAAKYALRGVSIRRVLEYRRICRQIDAFQPDVIHVQEQGDRFTASIVRRFAEGRAVVVTVHDPLPHAGHDSVIAKRYARGLATIRAAADAYHVHGPYCETVLRDRLQTHKPMAVTLHGTILEPKALGAPEPGGQRFLFFGRMEAYKGLATLLDAIDLLLPDHGVRIVLAGRGPELSRLRARIAANPAIELLDKFLTPQEAIAEFQRARAVIVPYDEATQSGVVSAAIANGRPVIASRVGGLVDGIRHDDDGLLVPAKDPRALVDAIVALTREDVAARLAAGARAAAAGRFSWTSVVATLHRLYADLVDSRSERLG